LGSAPDPAGGAYSAPPVGIDPLAVFNGSTSKGKEGKGKRGGKGKRERRRREAKGKGRGGEGKGREGMGEENDLTHTPVANSWLRQRHC